MAEETFWAFFGLWQRFGLLPERFTLDMGLGGVIHPTEQYYPLRPELLESAFYLHEVRGPPLPLLRCILQAVCSFQGPTLVIIRTPADTTDVTVKAESKAGTTLATVQGLHRVIHRRAV